MKIYEKHIESFRCKSKIFAELYSIIQNFRHNPVNRVIVLVFSGAHYIQQNSVFIREGDIFHKLNIGINSKLNVCIGINRQVIKFLYEVRDSYLINKIYCSHRNSMLINADYPLFEMYPSIQNSI